MSSFYSTNLHEAKKAFLSKNTTFGKMRAEWLERLTANAKVSTVLGSIPASSDTVESEAAAYEALLDNT
jgi:hypothetical protein